MSILISMALAAVQGPAVQPAPQSGHAMHAQHAQHGQPSKPGAKPQGEGCCCCTGMAAGGKMECCAKHGEGHAGEHSGHSAHR